jgi:RNA polymerase sigma-70 factor (sigma-E family)
MCQLFHRTASTRRDLSRVGTSAHRHVRMQGDRRGPDERIAACAEGAEIGCTGVQPGRWLGRVLLTTGHHVDPATTVVAMAATGTDADGFDEFYRGTAKRLLSYAYGFTGDPVEAQDLVQEAYTRAWQRWRRVRAYDDAEAWLRLVVTRLATDRWRRLGVRRAVAAASRPLNPVEPPSDDTVLLVMALRLLPATHRRAIVLFYLLDRSVAEIATETGASVNTVKSWLARGRTALADLLGVKAATGGSDVC